MKNILLIILVLMTWSEISFGQDHFILSRFQAIKDKNRVILTWSIRQNHSCQGVGILRSTDGRDFEQIGEILGLCGSPSEEQHFTYVDENPVNNKTNYYVLELGFAGKTEPPLKVDFIDLSTQTSKAIPNPFRQYTTIHFFNQNNEHHQIMLYDSQGKYVTSGKSNSDKFIIDLPGKEEIEMASFNFPQNRYFYVITNESGKKVSSGILLAGLE
jgi:hypothetical protein